MTNNPLLAFPEDSTAAAEQAGRDRLAADRVAHAARRAAAGLPTTNLGTDAEWPGRGLVITQTSGGRVRTTPALTDTDRVHAVLMARAVVDLDDRAAHLAADVAERDTAIAELTGQLTRARSMTTRLRDRLAAVDNLHSEAVRVTVTCADLCQCADEEPLGVCRECGEPVPGRTARVAAGATDVYPKTTHTDPDTLDDPADAEAGTPGGAA